MAGHHTRFRNAALWMLERRAPPGTVPLPDFSRMDRILLTYVNWRLGNNVLITPLVHAFTRALPDVHIEFLGGPAARAVLAGQPLGTLHTIRRGQVISPLGLAAAVRRIRRERYDAVVHVHSSTGTIGAFLTGLSGALHRIGCRRPEGNVLFTTAVQKPTARHKLDRAAELLTALGLPPERRAVLRLRPAEVEQGQRVIRGLATLPGRPRVAVFLSGRKRKGKAWTLPFFRIVLEGLRARGLTPIVVLGPDERRGRGHILRTLGDPLHVADLPIRSVAGVLRHCRLVITPDSGPMHLALAVPVPTVGLFRRPEGPSYGPRHGEGVVVFDPDGRDVRATLEAVEVLLQQTPQDVPPRPHAAAH